MSATEWGIVEGFVSRAATDCDGRVPMSARVVAQFVSRIAKWALRSGIPLEREVVFRRSTVGLFIEQECATLPKTTRNTYRSRLLRIGEVLAPEHQDAPLPNLNREIAIRPYSPDELIAWRSWAIGQRTPARRRDAKILLALGIGAGLSGGEISESRYKDISLDDGGVLVQVVIGRPRVIPVLSAWEGALVSAFHAGRGPDEFLFRPNATRPAPNLINHFTQQNGKPPSTSRMRTTWLVAQLSAGIPAKALMDAAGVRGFTSFERCVEYLPNTNFAATRDLLRGTGAVA